MLARNAFNFFASHLNSTPGNYLEIGVYNGDGCFELANKFKDKKVFCIDPFLEDGYTTHISGVEKGNALNNQRETALKFFSQCENINFFETTSLDFFNKLTDSDIELYNIDSVFIDGDHSHEGASIDYKLAMTVIGKKAGVIVFDDTNLPGVISAIDNFKNEYADRIESLDESNSVVYVRIKNYE